MKVLQINAVYGIGSTGRIVAEIDEVLVQSGIESIVATTQTTVRKDNIYIVGTSVGRKVHALLSRLIGKQAYFSAFATKRLLNWIKKEKPDVIHLGNLHANYVHLGMLLKYVKKYNIATVITLHDCWFFTGKCTHYTEQGCYKWQTGCHHCPQLKKGNRSWFFDCTSTIWQDKKRWITEIPRLGVIGVSDWITEEAKKSFLKDATIIKRIYNWIDLQIFYPRGDDVKGKYGIPTDKFSILCIGAHWAKDSFKFNQLIELSKRIREDMQIVLVGNVPAESQLPANVKALGYISSTDELAKLYSSMDVYVHLSREDTFGKVIAEAMACGTPAIVYNATACPELIGKGCGYVVEVGDIAAVCNALEKIQNDKKEAYSVACVEFVQAAFEKRMLIEETKLMYKDLLEGEKK